MPSKSAEGVDNDDKRHKAEPVVPLPFWLWIFKHTQGILTTATTIGVVYFHNVHSIYFVSNILTTSFLAKGLKLLIKQPRPEGSAVTKTHGMPSTHSSTTMFMGAYLSLALACHPHYIENQAKLLLLASPLLVLPPMIMYSRVRLGVHTVAQCLVGGALGLGNALLCTAIWQGWGQEGPGLGKSTLMTELDEFFAISWELGLEWWNA